MAWSRQAAFLLQTRATSVTAVAIPSPGPVNSYEHLPLFVVQGWR
jgi:hypothetical protein